MADRKAVANGNWNALATWDGGVSLPAVGDDVYANGFTVTINQNVTCLSLRTTSGTGIVAGGFFSMASAFDVTANIIAGSTSCLQITATSGTITVTGNITGTATNNFANGISHPSACNLVVVGNVSGGTFAGQCQAIQSNSLCGDLTITGNCVGSGAGSQHYAVTYTPSTAGKTLTINGNVTSAIAPAINFSGNALGTTTAVITGTFSTAAAGSCIAVAGNNVAMTLNLTGGLAAGSGTLGSIVNTGGTVTVNGTLAGRSLAGISSLTFSGSSPAACIVNGNVTGPSTGAGGTGIAHGGTGTLTVNGNVFGGTAGAGTLYGISKSSTGTLVVNGDVTGGIGGTSSHGINVSAAGSVTVNGTATAGISTGGAAYGVNVSAVATVFVRTAKSNDYPNAGVTQQGFGTVQANVSGWITVDSMEDGSGGWPACSGRHFVRAAGTNFCKMRESNAGAITTMGEVAADYPAVTDVRSGTAFNFGAQTGTLAVPPVGSVALGVPTDNTTGTAALTGGSIADAVLARNLAGGSDGGRTVRDALRASRNKSDLSGGTLTVYEEDDSTPAWTAAVTTAARDPVSSIDPA